MTTLGQLGERAIVERIRKAMPTRGDVACGIGDDCAILHVDEAPGLDWLLTADAIQEQIHFAKDTNPLAIGHKALCRALSDIAAMGGEPRWALVDLTAPGDRSIELVDGIIAGLSAAAERYDCAIVGGDTARGDVLSLHVFVVGSAPHAKAVRRSGAQPGDVLFVTGDLGGSQNGHHLTFAPRLREGQWLRDWATAMIDISDGLSIESHHLAKASGVGLNIHAWVMPIAEAASSANDAISPLDHALSDGEDFELLFTVPEERAADMQKIWNRTFDCRCTPIGMVREPEQNITIQPSPNDEPTALLPTGYEHFKNPTP
ncbi:MAG: thiamine-phosphate kinase [Verrucomicrobia bacterium]|nr:thiamine-phosphate kinase [Verrucomicrobiota bacterium]